MNEELFSLSEVTDRRGAPATQVALISDNSKRLFTAATTSLHSLGPVTRGWLELFTETAEKSTTVVDWLRQEIGQRVRIQARPRAKVEGWYELIVGWPLLMTTLPAAVAIHQELEHKGWLKDAAGRFHWPEEHKLQSVADYFDFFRTDKTIRDLPVRFALPHSLPIEFNPTVAQLIDLLQNWPIGAVIDLSLSPNDLLQLNSEIKGHRLAVELISGAEFVHPTLHDPKTVVGLAVAAYHDNKSLVVHDDPILPSGLAAEIAAGVSAQALIAGSPVTTGLPNPYTALEELK